MGILHASNLSAGMTENSQNASSSVTSANMSDIDFNGSSVIWSPIGYRTSSVNSYQEINIDSSESEFWVAFNHYTLASTGHNGHMLTCRVGGGSDAISLYHTNNILTLKYWTGSAWADISGQVSTKYNLGIAGGDLDITTVAARWDVHIKLHASAGWIRVYRGNLLILSFSGNTVFNSVTTVNQFRFHHASIVQTVVSEFLISTDRTIGLRCYTATVMAAGSVTGFTSGTFASVDEETPVLSTVDVDYIESATADQILTVNLDPLLNTIYKVHGVAVNLRALKIAGAPESVNAVVRMASTNYHGSDRTLGTSYAGRKGIWETNPNTGLAWTTADIAALEVGARSRT